MGDYDGALRLHKMDLELCENIGINNLLARTYGNYNDIYCTVAIAFLTIWHLILF